MPGTTPTPANYSPLIDELVTQEFLDANWEMTKRRRVYTDKLEGAGAFSFDASGKFTDWLARVGEYQDGYRDDGAQRTFNRYNHWVTYTAPWCTGLEITGYLTENDIMFAQSKQARVDITKRLIKDMSEDFLKRASYRLLRENGTSNTVAGISAYSGNGVPLYGLPTVFGYGTAALAYDPDAKTVGSAVAATDKEVAPNVTYCGVSTHPTNAISGVANKLTEATSPVIANWTSTAWVTASGTTFVLNAVSCLEHLINRCGRESDMDSKSNLGLLDSAKWRQLREAIRRSSTIDIVLQREPAQVDAGLYGQRNMIPFSGVNFYDDNDMPANVIYVLNTRYIKVRVFPQKPAGFDSGAISEEGAKRLFAVRQAPDIDTGGWKVVAKMVAQQLIRPDKQGMAYAFA